MQLVFIYGEPASGKLTIAEELARLSGLPLFHNHLVVDAVAAVFPFGSAPFVRLREEMWLRVIEEGAVAGRSLVFTFAPEPSVTAGFVDAVRAVVEENGGSVLFVALDVSREEQVRRLNAPSRQAFGKLKSAELLAELREDFQRCMQAMPQAALRIDTERISPAEAAQRIASALSFPRD